jgi:hypothetical protein
MGAVVQPKSYAPTYKGSAGNSAFVRPELMERAGLTKPWAAVALGAGLYLFQLLAMYLDGYQSAFSDPEYWRRSLEVPLLITYILLMHRLADVRARRAIVAIRPVVVVNDATFRESMERLSATVVRYQPVGILLFLMLGAVLQELWVWDYGYNWNTLSNKINIVIEYTLIGSIIYLAVARNRLFTRVFRQPLMIDVFNMSPLKPIAEWGLSIALAIIGGTTISMLLIWEADDVFAPRQLIVYSLVLGSTILVYFGSLFSTHRVMVRAKEEELTMIRGELAGMYGRLRESRSVPDQQEANTLSPQVIAWLSYERRIMDAPEWPHTAGTLRGLFASVLLPILLTVVQLLLRR